MSRVTADEYAAVLFRALAAQERRVLNLLLSSRRTAEPIVDAAGLDMRHFDQDDHRLVFAGWQVAREHDLSVIDTLRLIRRALREDGLWDDETPEDSDGMLHSDATLAHLGTPWVSTDQIRRDVFGDGDGLRWEIARNVTALVDAAEALDGARS